MVVPSLDELTAEAQAMRAQLGIREQLPALTHYTAHDETIVVGATEICEQTGRDLYAVVAEVVPQIYRRFGPAESIVVVDDNEGVLWILVATRTTSMLRTVPYHHDHGVLVWEPMTTLIGPTLDLGDVFHEQGMGAAIMTALHEVGKFN